MSHDKKLTRSQVAQLGGLAKAHKLGAEGMARLGSHGGATTVERYGKGHMKKLALRKHGYNVSLPGAKPTAFAPAVSEAAASGTHMTPDRDEPPVPAPAKVSRPALGAVKADPLEVEDDDAFMAEVARRSRP